MYYSGSAVPHSVLHMTMLPPPLPLPGAGAKRSRPRGGSISGRLRSASDLCDEGVISPAQKGVLKDMIIAGDDQLESAFERYERGDPVELSRLVEGGHLNRRGSIDLLGDSDLFLGCARQRSVPGARWFRGMGSRVRTSAYACPRGGARLGAAPRVIPCVTRVSRLRMRRAGSSPWEARTCGRAALADFYLMTSRS